MKGFSYLGAAVQLCSRRFCAFWNICEKEYGGSVRYDSSDKYAVRANVLEAASLVKGSHVRLR